MSRKTELKDIIVFTIVACVILVGLSGLFIYVFTGEPNNKP